METRAPGGHSSPNSPTPNSPGPISPAAAAPAVDLGSRVRLRPWEVELRPGPERHRPLLRVAAAAADCLLDRYRGARAGSRSGRRVALITGRQHEAGLRLRTLWEAAERRPRVIARYDEMATERRQSPPGTRAQSGAAEGAATRAEGARQALARALLRLDERQRQVVEDVCRHDVPAGPRMKDLRRALDRLAQHWRLVSEDEDETNLVAA